MTGLNRKLLRDLWGMRGQAMAIALVTAAGTVAFITLLGTLLSLEKTQTAYYERARFADIFWLRKNALFRPSFALMVLQARTSVRGDRS